MYRNSNCIFYCLIVLIKIRELLIISYLCFLYWWCIYIFLRWKMWFYRYNICEFQMKDWYQRAQPGS